MTLTKKLIIEDGYIHKEKPTMNKSIGTCTECGARHSDIAKNEINLKCQACGLDAVNGSNILKEINLCTNI